MAMNEQQLREFEKALADLEGSASSRGPAGRAFTPVQDQEPEPEQTEPVPQAIRHTAYEAMVAREVAEDLEPLTRLLRQGTRDYALTPNVAQDVWLGLYQAVAELLPPQLTSPEYAHARASIEEWLGTSQYDQLHQQTVADTYLAGIAAAKVAAEIIRKLREQQEKRDKKAAQQQAQQAQQDQQSQSQQQQTNNGGGDDHGNSRQEGQAAPQASGAGGAQDGSGPAAPGGQPSAPAGAQPGGAGDGQPSGSAAAGAGGQPGPGAGAPVASPPPPTRGERMALRRVARKASAEASDEVAALLEMEAIFGSDRPGGDAPVPEDSHTPGGWGLGDGVEQWQGGDMVSRAKRAQKLMQDQQLRRIARLAGRMRLLAEQAQRSRTRLAHDVVVGVQPTRDFGQLLPEELALMGHPVLKVDFWQRWAAGKTLGYREAGRKPLGRGPICLLIDESGSMNGARIEWAKAIMLTLLAVAAKERRDLLVMEFSSYFQCRVTTLARGRATAAQKLEITKHFWKGGTSFDKPLEEAMAAISTSEWKRADVIMITDDECAVSPPLLAKWLKLKKEKQFRAFGISVHGWGGHHLREFCDEVSVLAADQLGTEGDEQVLLKAFGI